MKTLILAIARHKRDLEAALTKSIEIVRLQREVGPEMARASKHLADAAVLTQVVVDAGKARLNGEITDDSKGIVDVIDTDWLGAEIRSAHKPSIYAIMLDEMGALIGNKYVCWVRK